MAKIFISYSHRDEKGLERLHAHFSMLRREGAIETWFDREILAGDDVDEEVKVALHGSDIFIALVSPDFLASNYCYEREMTEALQRHDEGLIRVIPIILEPCDWLSSPLGRLKGLPKDGKAISIWTNENIAYLDVVTELRRILSVATKQEEDKDKPITANREKGISRGYRIKRAFDSFDRDDFQNKAFETIQDYFRHSTKELNEIGEPIRARFEEMVGRAFTCTVLNKAARNREANITVHGNSEGHFGGGISYSFSKRAPNNTANGFIRVEADEYELYLKLDNFSFMQSRNEPRSPEEVAEALWREFVSHAGIDHE